MQRRRRLFQRRIAVCLLAGMFAAAGTSMLVLKPTPSAYAEAKPFDTSTAITRSTLTETSAASRGASREELKDYKATSNDGSWSMSDSDGVTGKLTAISADNPVV